MVEDLETLRQYLKLGSMLLLGHSNGGSIALGYAQQYPSHVEKLVLIDHELQGFDDSATYVEFAMKRKDDPIYSAALERLQTFRADTDEELQEGLNDILPFYFANPMISVPNMLETMQNKPSSWALNHQRAADRDRSTYLVDDLDKLIAKTLIMVGREDPFCSVEAAKKAHVGIARSELVILEDCGHFAWIENKDCLDIMSRFLKE